MTASKEELKIAIDKCNFRELVELIYPALRKFRDEEILVDGILRVYEAPVIALASYVHGEPVEYRTIVLPSESYDGFVSDEISQSGLCGRCRSESAGFSKEGGCVVCGETVGMT